MEPLDPDHLRVSDRERDRVAEVLREAAAEGRIDSTELDERLGSTYAAKTYAELTPITSDLPGSQHPVVPRPARAPVERTPAGLAPTYAATFAMWSETRRVGVWDVGTTHNAVALMGSVVLDLREARFPAGEVTINASAVMGSVEVWVNARTAVRVEGFGIMGSYTEGRSKIPSEVQPDSPLVRLQGVAFWGSVDVKRKRMPR